MEQKFIKFDEVLEKLGIPAERLNGLREQGVLRAYRDGSSWKFRTDEIERLATEGIPEPPPPSDIDLAVEEDLELDLADSDPELTQATAPAIEPSDLEFRDSDLDDTVTAETSDVALNQPEEPSDQSDSILLSEEELGESSTGPASTIIGRSELELEDADLDLPSEEVSYDGGSDVRLASAGASNVLSSAAADSDDVLDDIEDEPSHASAFENLDELEIDLAAESSRILSPEDVEKVKTAAKSEASAAGKKDDSDLKLDDLELAADGSDSEPTELSSVELGLGDEGSGSEIELGSESDDFVLDEPGGSDLALDSGINLVDPSDSGIALEDIPLDVGGSAILESLSLGGDNSDPELSLIASDSSVSSVAEDSSAELQTDDDFQLTPMGESDADSDDSSSQVIALDDDLGVGDLGGSMDDLGDAAVDLLSEADLVEETDDAVVLAEDEDLEDAEDFGTYADTAAAPAVGDYSLWNIMSLGACVVLLIVGGVMMIDMVRNIWSWGETYTLNSAIIDGLLGIFGLD